MYIAMCRRAALRFLRTLLPLTLLLAAGCASLPGAHRALLPADQRYNVLWITSESLNTKHLSVHGYDKPTSPHLEAFAKTATKFDLHFTASCWTCENIATYMSGVFSPVHGVVTRNRSTPSDWYLPLEILRDGGYKVPKLSGYINDSNYANLGFATVVEPIPPEEWIRRNRDQPFFIWHHILNPHLPYDPPPWAKRKFFREDLYPNPESKARVEVPARNGVVLKGKAEFKPEEDRPALHALYDAELLKMDQEFGRILRTVEELGLRERTIIIFSADHGEELLEHGFVGHASTSKEANLHDEVIHIPLLISWPGHVPEGLVITQQVQGIDIMPTVFDLLKIPPRDYYMGESLVPVMRDPSRQRERPVVIATSKAGYKEDDPDNIAVFRRAVRTAQWKLIANRTNGVETLELYDLRQDPGEHRNVAAAHPAKVRELRDTLRAWEDRCAGWAARHFTKRRNIEPDARRSWLARAWERWFPPPPLDLTGVENPPQITFPEDNAVLTADSTNGRVEVRWNGKKGIPYLFEVELGEGDYHFTNQIRVKEPVIVREFDKAYWNEYIVEYNPARVRVKIDRPEHRWGDWRSFQLK